MATTEADIRAPISETCRAEKGTEMLTEATNVVLDKPAGEAELLSEKHLDTVRKHLEGEDRKEAIEGNIGTIEAENICESPSVANVALEHQLSLSRHNVTAEVLNETESKFSESSVGKEAEDNPAEIVSTIKVNSAEEIQQISKETLSSCDKELNGKIAPEDNADLHEAKSSRIAEGEVYVPDLAEEVKVEYVKEACHTYDITEKIPTIEPASSKEDMPKTTFSKEGLHNRISESGDEKEEEMPSKSQGTNTDLEEMTSPADMKDEDTNKETIVRDGIVNVTSKSENPSDQNEEAKDIGEKANEHVTEETFLSEVGSDDIHSEEIRSSDHLADEHGTEAETSSDGNAHSSITNRSLSENEQNGKEEIESIKNEPLSSLIADVGSNKDGNLEDDTNSTIEAKSQEAGELSKNLSSEECKIQSTDKPGYSGTESKDVPFQKVDRPLSSSTVVPENVSCSQNVTKVTDTEPNSKVDLASTEASTGEYKDEERSTIAYEVHTKVEEQSKFKDDETLLPHSETLKMNPEEHLYVAPDENDVSASCQATPSEKQRSNANLPEVAKEGRTDETIDADYTEEKQTSDGKNISTPDLNEEEDVNILCSTAKDLKSTLPLVEETKQEQVCEETQAPIKEPKDMHDAHEASNIPESSNVGQTLAEGASDVTVTSTTQTDADKLETEPKLNSTKRLQINVEKNTEDNLQQHGEASAEQDHETPELIENTIHGSETTFDASLVTISEETCLHKEESSTPELRFESPSEMQDESRIEAKEKEYIAEETSEVQPQQSVHEIQLSDSQSVENDKSVETGEENTFTDDHSLSSESSKKDVDDLAISHSKDREILPVKVDKENIEASHVESEKSEKTLESVTQVQYSELPHEVEQSGTKEESLEAATTETGVEKILNERTNEAKESTESYVSSEKITEEDSHFDPTEKEIIQEEVPSITIHVISETTKSGNKNEMARDQEGTDEDGVVKGLHEDSTADNRLNKSLGEKEKTEYTHEEPKELNPQEDFHELDCGHTKTEVKSSTEEVLSSEVVFLQHDKDRGVEDQEYSVEKKSEAQTVNINDSFVADIAGVKEAEHEGLLHEPTKDSEINEKSSTAVEKNKEVVIAADNNTLESLLDHGKLDIRPDSRGFSPEKKEDKEDEPGAFEENRNIQKEEHEEQHSVIGTQPTEDDSRANDEGTNEKEKNEDQATVATRGVETKQEEADSQSSIIEGEDRKIHCPDVKLESLSPLAESSTEICHIDEPLDLAKPTDIAPDIIEPTKAPLAVKEKDIPEEPLPSESTEVKIPSAAIDPQLLQNDPTVTTVRDEIQKLEIENYPNAAEEAAKVEFERKGESDEPKEIEQESTSIKPAKNSESDLIQGSANETISVAEERNQLAEDHVSECVKDSNMGIEQKENQVDLSGNKNIGAEINDNSSLSVSGNKIPVPKDPEESSAPVISSGDEDIPQRQPVSVTVEREIEELEQANASVDVAETKRVECGDGTRSGKCGEEKGTIHDDNQIPESSQEEAAVENFQTGGEIPRSAESSHKEAKSEGQRISAEIKEAIENSLPTEIANTPASEEENLQTAEHLSERSRLTANNEELETENAERIEDKEVITNGAKEEEEVQRGEKSGSEVPHIIEKDPEDLTSNKCTVAEMKEDSSIAIPDKKIPVQGDSDESIETAISSEYKDQPVSVIGRVELEIDELKHADASEATRSNKDEEAKENNEDQATITTRGSETERDVAEGQSNIAEGEDQKIHDPDVKLENSSPPEKSSTDICRIDEPLDVSKPTEIAAQNEVSLSTKEMGIPEEPQSNESTVVTIISAGRDVQLLQKDPAVTAVQAEIQKPTTEDDPNAAPSCAEPSYEKAKSEEEQRLTDEIEAATRNSLPTETPNTSAFDKETLQKAEDLSEKNKLIAKEEELQTKNAERAEVKEVKTNEAKDEEEEGEVQRGENSGFEVPIVVEKDPVDCRSNKITAAIEIKEDSSSFVPDKKIPVQGDPEKSTETVISSEDKDIQPILVTRTIELEIDELKHVNASEAPASNKDEEAKEKNEDQATVATNGSETGWDEVPLMVEKDPIDSKSNKTIAATKDQATVATNESETRRDEVPLMVEKDPDDSKSNKTIAATEIKEESSSVVPDKKVAEQRDPGESKETLISSEDKEMQPVSVTRTMELEIDELKHIDASEAPESHKDEESKEKNEDQATVATNESETRRDEVPLMVEKFPDDSKSNKTSTATEIKEESSSVVPDKKVVEQRDPGESIETVISSEDKEIQPVTVTRTMELEIDELKHIDATEAPESNKDEESQEKNEDQATVATNESEARRDEVPLMVEKDPEDSKSNKTIAATEIKEESSSVVPDKKVAEQRDLGESIETVISSEDEEIQPISVTRTMELEIDELKHIDASEAPESNKDEESKEKNEDQAKVATVGSETGRDEASAQRSMAQGDDEKIHDADTKLESSSPYEKSSTDICHNDEPLDISESAEVAPDIIVQNEVSLSTKEMGIPEEPQSSKSTVVTVTSADGDVELLQKDPAITAVQDEIQKPKTENDPNAAPSCAEPSSEKAKGEEEQRLTDEIEEANRMFQPTETANTTTFGEEALPIDSSEKSKLIVTEEEIQTENAEKAEAKEVKTNEVQYEEEEGVVQRGENSGSKVPPIVETGTVDGTKDEIISPIEMKEDSSSAVTDKKIPVQGDPEESIETVISSEDKDIQPVSVTGTIKLEIDELKHVDASEAAGSNNDEESKEKNEDQATVATRASETERDEADSHSSITEGEDPKLHDPDVKLENLSPPEESSKDICYTDEHLDREKPTEIVQDIIEKDPALTAVQDEIQKVKTENDSNAASEAAAVESEAKGAADEFKEMEQESTSTKPAMSSESDLTQGSANHTLSVADERETPDQLAEDHIYNHEKNSNIGIAPKEEQVDLSSNKTESSEPMISSGEEDIPRLQPVSLTAESEIEEKRVNASEAIAEAERVECGDNATAGECGEEKGTIDDNNQIPESSKSMESTKSAPTDFLQRCAKETIQEAEDINLLDQHEDLNFIQHVQDSPIRTVQEGGVNDIGVTQKTDELEAAPLLSSHKDRELEADPGIVVDLKNSTGDKNVSQIQEEAAAEKFQAGGEIPICAEPNHEEAKSEEEQRIIDETKEATGKSLPTETVNTSASEEETPKIAEAENAERVEDKGLKTDEAKEEEEEGDVQRGENTGSEVPLMVEKDQVDLKSNEIITAETKDDSSSVVSDKKIPLQEDPEESIKTVISSEHKDIQPLSVTGTVELEKEELKHINASETAAEANSVECGGEKRTGDEPKEIPECSTLMVSAKSSPSDLAQASAKETTGKAEDIESQDPESLHVPTKDGLDDIDGNQDTQKPETALQLAPEEHVVLEADQKVIPRPENSQEVPQVQQEAAADAGCPEPRRKPAKSKEEQRLIDEREKAMSMSLPTEALEIAEQQSKEESKLVSEKDELQAENAEKAEDAAVKTDEEEEAEEHKGENSGSEAPVIVEAAGDVDVKVSTKKSHSILSGVGSKVKHSIAKVKKAITGKHSHTKPPSPKARE